MPFYLKNQIRPIHKLTHILRRTPLTEIRHIRWNPHLKPVLYHKIVGQARIIFPVNGAFLMFRQNLTIFLHHRAVFKIVDARRMLRFRLILLKGILLPDFH